MSIKAIDQAQPLRDLVEKNINPAQALKIVTVASGKGGVGKSSICVNMAIALSNLGYRVLVVDADFGLANIDVMLGVSATYNMGHMLRGEKTIHEIIQEGHNEVRFISGGSGVFELLRMDEGQLREIMAKLMRLRDPADVILFDAGAGINDNVMQLIDASTDTIIVTTPEPTAILDAYALVKTIVHDGGQESVHLVMNKCESKKEAQMTIEGFVQVIKRHLAKDVYPLGYVLYDHEVVKSIKRQTPVMISHPGSVTAKGITGITKNLMDIPIESGPSKKIAKLFEWLLG